MFSKIYVEPSAGTYIGDFMAELHKLSVKYNCDVNAKFNGKEITIKAENDQAKGIETIDKFGERVNEIEGKVS